MSSLVLQQVDPGDSKEAQAHLLLQVAEIFLSPFLFSRATAASSLPPPTPLGDIPIAF